MKKLFLTLLFTASCLSTQPYTLQQKINTLDYYCKKHYGQPHPFMAMLTAFSLVAELTDTCRTTPALTRHLPELMVFLEQANPLVDNAIRAFGGNTDRATALRPLLELSQEATAYMSEHLAQQAAMSATVRKQSKQQKRFVETILGVALVGGAVKYLIIGVLGLSGLFVLDRIYKTLTNNVKISADQITDYRGQVDQAIRSTCIDLYKWSCTQQRVQPNQSIIRNKPSRFVRVKRGLGRAWRSVKRGLKRITPFMNPNTIKEITHCSTKQQAERTHQAIDACLTHMEKVKICSKQEVAQIRGTMLQWINSNHKNARIENNPLDS